MEKSHFGPIESQRFFYTPDDDLQVHEEGAIKLICAPFQSHENGIPEWVKNSSDAYARENIPEAKRIIIIIFNQRKKNERKSISCLDFVGMTSYDIENFFRRWADPKAAQAGCRGILLQGGHGNGGKCYMTQMFTDFSQIFTVKMNRRCKYGVPGGSIRFGYIPDVQRGKDYIVSEIKEELNNALEPIGCTINNLPKEVINNLDEIKGFTLVSGFGPKGYESKIPIKQLIRDLREHPQMSRSIELCKIYIISDGKLELFGKPLALPDIRPMPGGEQPRIFDIPSRLIDPVSGEELSTTEEGRLHRGKLILYTSERSMRYGMKARHAIRFKSETSGDFGYVPISKLDIQSAYRDHIYGICNLESLERFKKNERAELAESPLTRAVEEFISNKIQEYASEFEARDRKKFSQQEKEEISKMNDALDRWKNKLLKEMDRGLIGPGEGTGTIIKPPLPKGNPSRIELSLSHKYAGLGVTFRPTIKYFDSNGTQIRAVPVRIVSDDNNIAMADDMMQISTFSFGSTVIWAETLNSELKSNKVTIEVVKIKNIDIFPNVVEVEAGTRTKLEARCLLANNDITSDIYLTWAENNKEIAGVSSAGLVYAFSPGETQVIAGDNKCQSSYATIKVKPGTGSGKGDRKDRGYPQVLISGFDLDPETGTQVNFSSDSPPIVQRPEDVSRNIWWINSSAPLARLYLDSSKGYGHRSREWRVYHLERFVEVIIQIILQNESGDNELLTVDQFLMGWGFKASEIQNAVISDLSDFIANGTLPNLN